MITGDFVNGLHLMVGLSTDTKPDTTSENTFFLEEDTGKVYYFSAGEWAEADADVAGIVAALLNKGALPAVTAADNGKVLKVVAGAWAAGTAGGSGGADVLTVTITYSGSFSSDTTFDEVAAAIAEGQHVDVKIDSMFGWFGDLSNTTATFYAISQDSYVTYLYRFDLTSNGVDATQTILIVKATAQTLTGTTPTIATAADNTVYTAGEVTSLTVTAASKEIDFTIIFTSGATAATLTMPSNIQMPDNFTVETNTRYEINVSKGYAVAAGWAVTTNA